MLRSGSAPIYQTPTHPLAHLTKMPPRKRAAPAEAAVNGDHAPKRRSTRQAAAVSNKAGSPVTSTPPSTNTPKPATKKTPAAATESKKKSPAAQDVKEEEDTASVKPSKPAKTEGKKGKPAASKQQKEQNADEATTTAPTTSSKRDAVTPDPDPDTIPAQNPDVVRHEGTWYWLLKAEPESRIEAGVDVRFSIDDLRARTKPEGWDGIRSYAARNNLRAMNAGDMAFFYHSNCKTPGIVGTMEIVREASEDKSARRSGTPYYDPKSTREDPRWSLVHVEFRRKFAVPILLPELRELGQKPGSKLASMQLLKQSRLSVTKVSAEEWETLVALADEKAKDAGLEHEE